MAALNIPFMSPGKYQSCHEKLAGHIHNKACENMERAATEEANLARELGEVDDKGHPYITVVGDGARSKRSYNVNYNALSGVACVIGKITGKILFLGVRNKYCCICERAIAKNIQPIPYHKCYKNWDSTSTGMETDIIVEGFRCSLEMYGLIFLRLVGDGDSSMYNKLVKTRPYANTLVQKIECKNHLLRNFCRKLREISGKKRSTSKNCAVPIFLRKHVLKSILRIRTACSKAVLYRTNEEKPLTEKIQLLCKDLKNIPSHVFGEHSKCQEIGYFECKPNQS
ncbi:unnamed protein product [Psylliodes chrysocephalus]|uniref:Mutator-like transposase domain-containing protein n=1 Tax=Psylliodes chrysocephalus TaxID=3402493 RepID=A0A9P0CWD5_9CUCU|nr:unnamed protein product [Psylliodes chrysocephala]